MYARRTYSLEKIRRHGWPLYMKNGWKSVSPRVVFLRWDHEHRGTGRKGDLITPPTVVFISIDEAKFGIWGDHENLIDPRYYCLQTLKNRSNFLDRPSCRPHVPSKGRGKYKGVPDFWSDISGWSVGSAARPLKKKSDLCWISRGCRNAKILHRVTIVYSAPRRPPSPPSPSK